MAKEPFAPEGSDSRPDANRIAGANNGTMLEQHHDAEPVTVVVASSDANLLHVLAWTLAHDSRLDVVSQARDGDAVLSAPKCDLVVVDVAIGGLGILGVLDGLRRRYPAPAVVVLAHTGPVYLRHAMAAEGAADYVVIPDDLEELPARLVSSARTPEPVKECAP